MSGELNLGKLISSMKPILNPQEYVFGCLVDPELKLLSLLDPIGSFKEKEGLTVIVEKNTAQQHKLNYSGVFCCITLSVHSSLDAVGLTAAVATKLAQCDISANVVAAYYHDHIFIAKKDAQRALAALEELVTTGV